MHHPLATLRNRQSDTWPRSLDSKRCCSVSFTNLSWKHLTSSFPTLSDALASGHFFCLRLHPRTQSSAPEGHSLETVFSALKRLPPSSGHQLGISPTSCMSCVSSSQELSLTWGLVLLSSVSVCPLFIFPHEHYMPRKASILTASAPLSAPRITRYSPMPSPLFLRNPSPMACFCILSAESWEWLRIPHS